MEYPKMPRGTQEGETLALKYFLKLAYT